MKPKLLLLALFMAMASGVFSQTFFWESFDGGQMPPSGWTIDGLSAQWAVSVSTNAGGTAPEAKFTYIQQTTTTTLVSPMVDLTGFTDVKFSFRFFYDWYANPAPKIGVATRSHSGTWSTVWQMTPTANVGPQKQDIDIANSDVGQSEFQVGIFLNGNMYNLDYVFMDDFLLFNPLNLDGTLLSIGQTEPYFLDPVPVKGTIMNTGITTITDAEVDWQLDGGAVHPTTFTGLSMTTQQTYDFTCADLLAAVVGPHDLKVWISKINGVADNTQTNDTLEKTVTKICHSSPKKPLMEEFTSSTCAPCASFNSGFVPWCADHDTSITLVKYQMNWPGAGDPYYTLEGGVRREFYGVGFVPDLYCNGSEVNTDVPSVQAAFDGAVAQIGMMDIAATHTLTGHVIDVSATVLPYADFTNCNLYVAVIEEVTHNNVGSNGETSFEHVMMKMVPDASGTSLSLSDRVPYSFSQSVDLTGTNVENWNDLMVVVFVQDQGFKMVYQSVYSIENGTLATEARLSSISQDGTPLAGFSSDVFSYDVHLSSGATVVPEVTATPIDPKATVIIVPANELPGTTTIDVFAQDLTTHQQYGVNFLIGGVGINDQKVKNIVVYPNPSKGVVFLINAEHSDITLSTTGGETIKTVNDFTGTSLNLSSLPKGVYILSIEKQDNTVIRKKIVLL